MNTNLKRDNLRDKLSKLDKKGVGTFLIKELTAMDNEEVGSTSQIAGPSKSELTIKEPIIDESNQTELIEWHLEIGIDSSDDEELEEKEDVSIQEIEDPENNITEGLSALELTEGTVEGKVQEFNKDSESWISTSEGSNPYQCYLDLSIISNKAERLKVIRELRTCMIWASDGGTFRYNQIQEGQFLIQKLTNIPPIPTVPTPRPPESTTTESTETEIPQPDYKEEYGEIIKIFIGGVRFPNKYEPKKSSKIFSTKISNLNESSIVRILNKISDKSVKGVIEDYLRGTKELKFFKNLYNLDKPIIL